MSSLNLKLSLASLLGGILFLSLSLSPPAFLLISAFLHVSMTLFFYPSLHLSVFGTLPPLAVCLNLNFYFMSLYLMSLCVCPYTILRFCLCMYAYLHCSISPSLLICVSLTPSLSLCLSPTSFPLPLTPSLSDHICPTPWSGTQPGTQIPESAFSSYSRYYVSAAVGGGAGGSLV